MNMRTDPDAQAMQAAIELLETAIESEVTQELADAGMCAQWDVDALKLIATLRERLAQSRDGEAFYFYRHKDRVTWDEVPKEFCDNLANDPQFEFRTLYTTPTAAQTDAIRMGLEAAAKIPRQHAITLQDGIFGTRFPDEALAILRATDAMADKIRAIDPATVGKEKP